jgi:hypothetical protein
MRSLVFLALVACRSYAVPSVPQPTLPPDPVLEVKSSTSQVRTGSHDVCDGESRCRTEDVTRDEVRSETRLNGKLLSYGQVRLLDPAGDGAYAKQLAEYAERSKPCRTARKLKIAGIATTVVGTVIALIDKISTAGRIGGIVLAGGGVVLLVYAHQKGAGCDDVYRFYVDNQLNLAEKVTVADRRKELDEIVARFNAAHPK